MKRKESIPRVFVLFLSFFIAVIYSFCGNGGGASLNGSDIATADSASTIASAKHLLTDTLPKASSDTIFAKFLFTHLDSIKDRLPSANVYIMKWPVDDFLNKLNDADTVRFKFLPSSSNWVSSARILNNAAGTTVPVNLSKYNNKPVHIHATGHTDSIWLRESRLSKMQIQNDIINKVVKESNFKDFLTSPHKYEIVIEPYLSHHNDPDDTTQFVSLKLHVEDTSHTVRSSTEKPTNPCPACNN